MVADGHRLGFPILAGSSLPVTWRLPDVELPLGCQIEEALMVGVGGSDPMDYHALEAMQCMIERRSGGETGVKSVQLIEGDGRVESGRGGDAILWNCSTLPSRAATPLAAKPTRTAAPKTCWATASCPDSSKSRPRTSSSTTTASRRPS